MPFPAPEDLPNLGIKPWSPVSLALQADSLLGKPLGKPVQKYATLHTWDLVMDPVLLRGLRVGSQLLILHWDASWQHSLQVGNPQDLGLHLCPLAG